MQNPHPHANPELDGWFAMDAPWQAEVNRLRAILLSCDLAEERKWYQPCYTAAGGNVAIVHRFKAGCGIGFFKGVLLKDPQGLLALPGANSRVGRVMRFTGLDGIARQEDAIRSFVAEAVALERAGAKVDLPPAPVNHPPELEAAFDGRPDLRTAFEALTPGRRRAYVLHFNQAKQPATRAARIEKAAPRILAGQGINDR